jgi:hypothetical protein
MPDKPETSLLEILSVDKTKRLVCWKNVKIYSKILTLVGHTIQDDKRGSEVLKRAHSSQFQVQKA